jgi:hypothetical protein
MLLGVALAKETSLSDSKAYSGPISLQKYRQPTGKQLLQDVVKYAALMEFAKKLVMNVNNAK